MKVTKNIYEFALDRIEELLPLVNDDTPPNDKKAIELVIMSDIVISYEKEHYPLGGKAMPVGHRVLEENLLHF